MVVDTREQYAYRFATQQVTTTKRALPCGDYGLPFGGQLIAAVERKSLIDLVTGLIAGKLRFAIGELATLPRAAVVVEDRCSQIFKLDRVRPAMIADGLAELQVRWPTVPIVLAETRRARRNGPTAISPPRTPARARNSRSLTASRPARDGRRPGGSAADHR
jgi:ERCC4-type nuclease